MPLCVHPPQAPRRITSHLLISKWPPASPWEEGRITTQQEQGVDDDEQVLELRAYWHRSWTLSLHFEITGGLKRDG